MLTIRLPPPPAPGHCYSTQCGDRSSPLKDWKAQTIADIAAERQRVIGPGWIFGPVTVHADIACSGGWMQSLDRVMNMLTTAMLQAHVMRVKRDIWEMHATRLLAAPHAPYGITLTVRALVASGNPWMRNMQTMDYTAPYCAVG